MKVVKRIGVFETNSSSTHSLSIVKSDMVNKNAKYGVITSKLDKLYMACGCAEEIYPQRDTDEVREAEERFANGEGVYDKLSYQTVIRLLVESYCKLTGEDFDTVHNAILKENKSGRACHMRFFEEGALYDADWDYMPFYKMFRYGTRDEIIAAVDLYFDDEYALMYGERYGGI